MQHRLSTTNSIMSAEMAKTKQHKETTHTKKQKKQTKIHVASNINNQFYMSAMMAKKNAHNKTNK